MTSETNQNAKGVLAWWVKNPVAANLTMMLLILGGIWSANEIQKEVFPDFLLDIVEIDVSYPGASPEEVEQAILLPIEENIKSVTGIKEITSTAREGRGSVTVELVAGVDRIKTFQEIDQAVNRVQSFPDDIERPEVKLQSRQRDVLEIGLSGDVDIWVLRKISEELRNILLNHPDIAQVELDNAPSYVTHVEIPRHNLSKYGLSLGEISEVIANSSDSIPAGTIETSSGEILLRLNDRKQWAEELSQIEILATKEGGSIKLADIAKITDGFQRQTFHSRYNNQPSVELSVYRLGDKSPLDIDKAVRAVMQDFETTLPEAVTYRIQGNRADDYNERLGLLLENGIGATLIVLTILTLFLEIRLAFWVMIGMTISFIGGILFLPMLGISINMISMFAFIVVLGIVVDDAIVIGENTFEYLEQGLSKVDAAIKGVKEMAVPVTFTILTTIVAFFPILFMPGTTGKFWYPLPVVVITILLVSLFEALFILPAHLAHIGVESPNKWAQKLRKRQRRIADHLKHFIAHVYQPFLERCLRARYVAISAGIGLLIVMIGFVASGHMGVIMMPEVAADEIEAGVRLPVGVTPEQSGRVALAITESTTRMFEKHNLYEVAYGIKTNVRGENFIDVEIVMKPPTERDMTAAEVIKLWRDEIGDLEGIDQITFEAERGPGGYRQDISVDLSHDNIEVLAEASQRFVEVANSFTETSDVSDNYSKGKIQYDFQILPEGRRLGLTSAAIGEQLRAAFFGSLAKRQLRGTNEVEVRVKLPLNERQSLFHLENFLILTPSGTEVPLFEVATVKSAEAFSSINRRDGRRVISVGMDVEPKRATSRVRDALSSEVLPELRREFPGLTWTFKGSGTEMRESTQVLWGGFGLALAVVYSLLAVAFSNYWQPLIVMSAIPFGAIGAILGHILLDMDLSLVSLMGMIALAGVVVNDSLIMIVFANQQRKIKDAYEAIRDAGVRRFRPILLTTLTTAGGLTPIILEDSSQARHLIPMAVSLGFGIVFATLVILILVPCLYMILEDIRTARSALKDKDQPDRSMIYGSHG